MHSALGYEAICKKKKGCNFFTKKSRKNSNYWFGWPATFQKRYNYFYGKKSELILKQKEF